MHHIIITHHFHITISGLTTCILYDNNKLDSCVSSIAISSGTSESRISQYGEVERKVVGGGGGGGEREREREDTLCIAQRGREVQGSVLEDHLVLWESSVLKLN